VSKASRRVWARLRDPKKPGRQVLGVTGLPSPDPEDSVWELIENEGERPMDKTRREALLEWAGKLREKREALAAEACKIREEAADVLARGRPAKTSKRDYAGELSVLDEAIRKAEAEAETPEVVREHVQARRERIAAEREALRKERAPLEKRVERARKALAAAEDKLGEVGRRQRDRLEALEREEMDLRALEDALPEEQPAGTDPARVECFLDELRARRLTTYIQGQDASLDEALRIYELEKAELRRWGANAEVQRRNSGSTPPLPVCAAYYSRDELRRLTGESNPPRPSIFSRAFAKMERAERAGGSKVRDVLAGVSVKVREIVGGESQGPAV